MSRKRDRWKRKRDKRVKLKARAAAKGEKTVDAQGGTSVGGEQVNPADGAIILTCGHHGEGRSWHWWHFSGEPIGFTRPDGTKGESNWIVACDSCYVKTGGDPGKLEIRGDGTWDAQGGKPVMIRDPGKN